MGWGIGRTPAPKQDLRQVVVYGGAVVGASLIVLIVAALFSTGNSLHCDPEGGFASCFSASQYVLVFAPPVIVLIGAIGAAARTLAVWRRRGPWMLWHGGMWFLFAVMIVYVGLSGSALMA